MTTTLLLGDCLNKLKELKENSIDAVITDPPYGLAFMNKHWDYDVPSVEIWKEVWRVLKPGGHLLSFGGTRTYHRMVVNIEDAGFEIRDQIQWIYGSGFPKSLDISKAIDKEAGAKRKVVGTKLGQPGYSLADNGRTNEVYGDYHDPKSECAITAPATDAAKEWQGFGTALKPSNEPICLARKPLSEKTVAKNVLKWGTGGLNIDACRVEASDANPNAIQRSGKARAMSPGGDSRNVIQAEQPTYNPQGRFPANLILDEEAGEMLDAQSGPCKTGALTGQPRVENKIYSRAGSTLGKPRHYTPDAATGASRFFYCAKASKRERGTDNAHPTVKPISLMRYLVKLITPPNGIVLDPFMGSGTTGIAAKEEKFKFIGIERDAEYFKIAEKRI